MNQATFNLLLDYLYNKFAMTFVISLIGVAIREIVAPLNTGNNTKTRTLIAASVFSTVLSCALNECFKMPFSIYVLVCMIIGLWARKVLTLVTNGKFMSKLIANITKNITNNVISKAISDTLKDDAKKEEKNKDTDDTKT